MSGSVETDRPLLCSVFLPFVGACCIKDSGPRNIHRSDKIRLYRYFNLIFGMLLWTVQTWILPPIPPANAAHRRILRLPLEAFYDTEKRSRPRDPMRPSNPNPTHDAIKWSLKMPSANAKPAQSRVKIVYRC
jgi:hypothetical protein